MFAIRHSWPRLTVAAAAGALLLPALAVFAPCGWRLYLDALARRSAPLYQPRERVAGTNEPAAPRVAPALEQLDSHALEEAARYASEHGSRALLVSRHDHIVFERYWHGSSFTTLIDAGTFTPLLAALATGHALSHRQIGWPDEPVGIVLPEWANDPRGAITVRNLMQNSSGLAPAASSGRPPTDLIAAALAEPLSGIPGATRREQAADAQLLALVLARATRERYAAYLSETLWRPLGAADAWLWLDKPGGAVHAECCMLARQGDWIRVAQLLLRDGNYRGAELIRPGWVTLMRAPARGDPRYGAFVQLASPPAPGHEPYAARDLFLVGGTGGNRMWLVPALQLAIVRIAPDTDAGWDDSRIPNLIIRGARDYVPPAAQPGADVSGLVPGHPP